MVEPRGPGGVVPSLRLSGLPRLDADVEAGIPAGQQVEVGVRLLLEAERERGEVADAAWDAAEQDRRDPAKDGEKLRQVAQDLGDEDRRNREEDAEEDGQAALLLGRADLKVDGVAGPPVEG